MRKLVIGDMAGVCFPHEGLAEKDRIEVDDINARWTGVKVANLKRCADRAFKGDPMTGPPGLVIAAVDARKANIVLDIVKRGLVNHLLIDEDLQEALERHLGLR